MHRDKVQGTPTQQGGRRMGVCSLALAHVGMRQQISEFGGAKRPLQLPEQPVNMPVGTTALGLSRQQGMPALQV